VFDGVEGVPVPNENADPVLVLGVVGLVPKENAEVGVDVLLVPKENADPDAGVLVDVPKLKAEDVVDGVFVPKENAEPVVPVAGVAAPGCFVAGGNSIFCSFLFV